MSTYRRPWVGAENPDLVIPRYDVYLDEQQPVLVSSKYRFSPYIWNSRI